MDYKRLELYVWWTCNQKCTYCIEFPTMEKAWKKKISKYDLLKDLIKYKKLWYNHVTYLWWEPFIQGVFLDALKLWKKFWYTILVTTNCTTLHIEAQAQKFLPYIDELFLSVEAISIEQQQKISRTKNYVHWEKVFQNIEKFWKWKFLKANIVITQDNKKHLLELVEYLHNKWVKNIAVTYPDITLNYYWKKHILEKVAPSYKDCFIYVEEVINFCFEKSISLKIPDFPFCIFPKNKIQSYIYLTDDYNYWIRLKKDFLWDELDRRNIIPRRREHFSSCRSCIYKSTCWGPSRHYKKLYWTSEINPINE